MQLELPSREYKDSFIEAVREFQADRGHVSADTWYQKLLISELETDFDSFVAHERSHAQGENLPEGYVAQSDFWLIDEGEFIGRVKIRHRLNEHLERIGGHIGYDIRPSRRRQGYGSNILKLALPKAKELGISRVLLTCNATNEPSRKIIEKNGGVLENREPNPETGVDKLRYWISIE